MGAAAFRITGFVDEISADPAEQIAAAARIGLHGIDVRSADGINVLDLGPARLVEVRRMAADAGLDVQAVGSPVNKVVYSEANRVGELEKLRRAIEAAAVLETRRIRIFSPEWPADAGEPDHAAVRAWMAEQIALAADADVVLLHENDARYYGAYPANARRLMDDLAGPHFRLAYDTANTVLIGFRTDPDWLSWMMPHLDTIHVKDAVEAEGRVVPAGDGDGGWPAFLAAVVAAGWQGPLTLEPHLAVAGHFGGFSGEERFAAAAQALRRVLEGAGGTWA